MVIFEFLLCYCVFFKMLENDSDKVLWIRYISRSLLFFEKFVKFIGDGLSIN